MCAPSLFFFSSLTSAQRPCVLRDPKDTTNQVAAPVANIDHAFCDARKMPTSMPSSCRHGGLVGGHGDFPSVAANTTAVKWTFPSVSAKCPNLTICPDGRTRKVSVCSITPTQTAPHLQDQRKYRSQNRPLAVRHRNPAVNSL